MKRSALSISLLAATLTLSACGGSDSDSSSGSTPPPPAPPTAFTVASTTPASAATGVARTTAISATMSSAANAATVDNTSAQLLGPEGNVIPTIAQVDGTTLKLTAQGGLLPGGTAYTAKLSTAIKSTTGQSLTSAFSLPFTTAEQKWDPQPAFLGDTQQRSGSIQSALALPAPDGSTTVIWHWGSFLPTSGGPMYASRLAPGASVWSEPQIVTAGVSASTMGGVNAVVAPNGNIYVGWVVYMDQTADSNGAYVAIFDAAAGKWTTTTLAYPGGHRHPQLSVDAKGAVTALAGSIDGARLYATRLAPGSTAWSSVKTVADVAAVPPGSIIDSVTHQGDKDGNVIAAWRQREGTRPGLYTSRYDAATDAWSAPQLLDARLDVGAFDAPLAAGQIALVVDDRAGAVLAWVHLSSDVADQRYIASARAAPGSGTWSAITQLSDQAVQVADPRLAASPAGAVTAVYAKDRAYLAVRSAPGAQAWDRVNTQTAVAASLFATAGKLSVDGAGNLTMLWTSSANDTGTSRYSATTGKWETLPSIPMAGPDGSATGRFNIVQAVHRNGEVVTTWTGANQTATGTRNYVGVNRFR